MDSDTPSSGAVSPLLQGPRPAYQKLQAEGGANLIAEAGAAAGAAGAASSAPSAPSAPSAGAEAPDPQQTSPQEAERALQSDLLALGYHFDDDGYLRNASNARPQEHELAAAQELVVAVASYVHRRMTRDLGYTRVLVPSLEEAAVPQARCPVFLSQGYDTKDRLLFIVQGSGRGLEPGIWSRTLCITQGLSTGSMLPQLHAAAKHDFGVIVINTNSRSYIDPATGQKHPIIGSERPETHAKYMWERFVAPSAAKHLFVMAFGYGGEVGISTNKLPPRGPVGLSQLVSYKYQIKSNGSIRD